MDFNHHSVQPRRFCRFGKRRNQLFVAGGVRGINNYGVAAFAPGNERSGEIQREASGALKGPDAPLAQDDGS